MALAGTLATQSSLPVQHVGFALLENEVDGEAGLGRPQPHRQRGFPLALD